MKPAVFAKPILFGGQACTVCCDGRCDKAWGINGRPRLQLDADDADDTVDLADDEVGTAPGPGRTVGISEGGDMKPSATPLTDGRLMNRWCSRECERSRLVDAGDPLEVPDYSQRVYNQPWKHRSSEQAGKGGSDELPPGPALWSAAAEYDDGPEGASWMPLSVAWRLIEACIKTGRETRWERSCE